MSEAIQYLSRVDAGSDPRLRLPNRRGQAQKTAQQLAVLSRSQFLFDKSHADGRHQRANHLVELAGGGSQYSSESGISHIQKRLYPCFLAGSLVLLRIRLFRCQARTRPLTITYQRGESRLAKHTVPDSYRYGSRIRPEGRVAAGRWTKLSKRFEAVFLKLL